MLIVRPNAGWILDKIAERIKATNDKLNTGVEMELSTNPTSAPTFDLNYYVDVYNCYRYKSAIKDVGWLNSFHEGFDPSKAMSLDFIVFQNKKYQQKMIELGYPAEKTKVIYPGVDLKKFFLRKITIGIFQRGVHKDKGNEFMFNLPDFIDLKNFAFVFVGKGWDNVVNKYSRMGIETDYYPAERYDFYPMLYEGIEYLLIPSLKEGGPMCLLEALAMGIPVIASKVGMVEDFGVEYTFEPGNYLELAEILTKIEEERIKRRKKVEALTWENHVKQLIKVFEKVLE